MVRRFRTLFFALTALGYGLLGGGPSLWALGLETPEAECVMAGCTCHAHGGRGACCCRMQMKLLKKYPDLAKTPFYMKLLKPAKSAPMAPGRRAVASQPCGDHDAAGLPLLSLHLAPALVRVDRVALARPAPSAPFVPAPDFVPAPLDHPPSVRPS